jgi:hypothetical protein
MYCCTIHKNQKMADIRWTDKEYTAQIHNWILFSHRKREILSFAAALIELEITKLGERGYTQKDKYHFI